MNPLALRSVSSRINLFSPVGIPWGQTGGNVQLEKEERRKKKEQEPEYEKESRDIISDFLSKVE